MGELLFRMARFDEALGAYRAAIELSPGDDYYYLRTALAFWKAGKATEAVKSVQLASDLNPSEDLYPALIALLLEEDGKIDEAITAQDRAKKLDRYDEERLSRIMAELGIEP